MSQHNIIDRMTKADEARKRMPSGRTFLLLVLIVGIVLGSASSALAKTSKKKSGSSKNSGWEGGTWENGRYINSEGKVKAKISTADKAKLPKLSGLQNKKILFIGASRTYRTSKAVKDSSVYFYGCGGATFKWFFQKRRKKKPAYLVIRAFIKAHPRGTVIIDLGGNDLSNINAYIGFYRELIRKYPKVTFYFRGILPRSKDNKSNVSRKKFNRKLEEALPGHVINLYDKVYKMSGFKTVDGIHYPKKQNRRIYEWTMAEIGRYVSVNLSTGKVTELKGAKKKAAAKKATREAAAKKAAREALKKQAEELEAARKAKAEEKAAAKKAAQEAAAKKAAQEAVAKKAAQETTTESTETSGASEQETEGTDTAA